MHHKSHVSFPQSQTEDAKWTDEGSTRKEQRAAAQAAQAREKAEAQARKKALLDAADAADNNEEANLKGKVRLV